MPTLKELLPIFQDLVGKEVKTDIINYENLKLFEEGNKLGYSQFNEVLLLLGFDRVCHSFFQYLIDGGLDYSFGSSFKTNVDFEKGVDRFMILALLFFGNIKFAFQQLSNNPEELRKRVEETRPIDKSIFINRHDPINKIIEIPENKTYLLGYLIANKIESALKKDPNDQKAKQQLKERDKILEIGMRNHIAYLSSDHLDVYIATSMREEHEYIFTNQIIKNIFTRNILQELKLRWFDPTQAFCENRIDKGLAEALMLRRAKCTVYLVQESDTLGKDSELASTLAQGKPVIAFVPKGDKNYVDYIVKNLKTFNPEKSEKEIILDQLKIFNPKLAWEDKKVNEWANDTQDADIDQMRLVLYETVKYHYDDRAAKLREKHPLGIQVNLKSGVANGVLVVRDENSCAKLLYTIMLDEMHFKIDKKIKNNYEYLYLQEEISECIFRFKTGDPLLTNTFWNFYLYENNI